MMNNELAYLLYRLCRLELSRWAVGTTLNTETERRLVMTHNLMQMIYTDIDLFWPLSTCALSRVCYWVDVFHHQLVIVESSNSFAKLIQHTLFQIKWFATTFSSILYYIMYSL